MYIDIDTQDITQYILYRYILFITLMERRIQRLYIFVVYRNVNIHMYVMYYVYIYAEYGIINRALAKFILCRIYIYIYYHTVWGSQTFDALYNNGLILYIYIIYYMYLFYVFPQTYLYIHSFGFLYYIHMCKFCYIKFLLLFFIYIYLHCDTILKL